MSSFILDIGNLCSLSFCFFGFLRNLLLLFIFSNQFLHLLVFFHFMSCFVSLISALFKNNFLLLEVEV